MAEYIFAPKRTTLPSSVYTLLLLFDRADPSLVKGSVSGMARRSVCGYKVLVSSNRRRENTRHDLLLYRPLHSSSFANPHFIC